MKRLASEYENDWNAFVRDILGVRLDREQRKIVDSVQYNRRTSVRSGHARGKDYVGAVISLCFLYTVKPSKVVNTAPTGRQVSAIMMTEIKKIWNNSKWKLGGEVQSSRIIFDKWPDWYLIGFKASDKSPESWTGFHSPNILVVVTEASGIEAETFNAIEGVLTGSKSRLLLIFNPVRNSGEAYNSARSPLYAKFKLNCLRAPNVRAKKILIPGQVDYDWVKEKINNPGWCSEIDESQIQPVMFHDFKWEGKWYRPSDLFLVKVLGEFPREGEDQLIPLSWIEAANNRWADVKKPDVPLLMGCDIAGMGVDTTVLIKRYGNYVEPPLTYSKSDHMVTAGRIKVAIEGGGTALIDTIGEGAGVHSRLQEMGCNSISAKFSESAEDLHDLTGEREFANMRAYCYWAVRDALDPRLGGTLALPLDDELTQELTATRWDVQSNGKIRLVSKDEIKSQLGRSPDKADALALSYFPTEQNVPRLRFI